MTSFLIEDILNSHKRICHACGVDVFDESGFCDFCKRSLPFNDGKTCKVCGVKLEGDADCCALCRLDRGFFDKAFSSFDYVGVMQSIIKRFKYGNAPYFAEILAKYMTSTLQRSGVEVDVIVAVPLTEGVRAKRGYNQAELLAQKISQATGLDFVEKGVVKVKETPQQEQLSYKMRRENLLGAFSVPDKSLFAGKRVLVVDDVKTTGTTLNRMAKVLKQSKATKVYGLTAVSVTEKIKTLDATPAHKKRKK